MRTPEKLMHSALAAKVSSMIAKRLHVLRNSYRNDTETFALLDSIECMGTGGIRFCNGRVASPDDQFRIGGDAFSGVVLEIASSQSYGGLGGLN